MREALSEHEINRLAKFLRGGATWEEVIARECADVSPGALERWKPYLLELAAKPGFISKLRPPSPSAEEDRENMRRFFNAQEPRERVRVILAGSARTGRGR